MPRKLLNFECWEAAARALTGNNLAARGYQTFDILLLTAKLQKRNKYF
jgi:hypothetical protein